MQSFVLQYLHDLGDRDGGRGKGCDKRAQRETTRQCRAQFGQRAPLPRAAFDGQHAQHFLAPASELADTEKAPLAAQFRRDEEGEVGLP